MQKTDFWAPTISLICWQDTFVNQIKTIPINITSTTLTSSKRCVLLFTIQGRMPTTSKTIPTKPSRVSHSEPQEFNWKNKMSLSPFLSVSRIILIEKENSPKRSVFSNRHSFLCLFIHSTGPTSQGQYIVRESYQYWSPRQSMDQLLVERARELPLCTASGVEVGSGLEAVASPPLFFSIGPRARTRAWARPTAGSGCGPGGAGARPPVEFDARVRTLADAQGAEELG